MRYSTSKKIDYISCTVSQFMIADDTFGKSVPTRPRQRNYDLAKVWDIGVFIQWHSTRSQMRINIQLNGTTLANMREIGFADYDILHWLKSMPDAKFSRIDIAVTSERIDGTIHDLPPHAINYLAKNGMCETRLKIDKPVANSDLIVETCYIGSRKSRNRLFRAYDKGLELGKEANRMIRYELETRKNATHIANEIHDKRQDIGAIIRRYIDFPQHEVWCEIMDSEIAENYRIDDDRPQHIVDLEKIQARKQWLLQSVAPAMATLAYQLDEGFSDKFWDTFAQRVAYLYNEKIDKELT